MLQILNLILLLVVALAIPGVINRTRARLSGRMGIRFTQHLHNVALLLRKGAVYSPTTTALFRLTPVCYFASALVALLFIPVGDLHALLSFKGDMVCFAYTLAIGRFFLILAALDTGSSFEGMGASREALYGALVEPSLMLIFGTLALLFGYSSFDDIFSAARHFDVQLTIVLMLMAYLVIKILFVEAGRVPVDDPRTHLELTMIHEVMCLDYCGIDLALIQMGSWMKSAALAVIAANAVAMPLGYHWWIVTPLAILLAGVPVGVVESSQARNKLVRNTIFLLTIVAMAAIVFFMGYLIQLNIHI
ncbi:MAG: NADH-quinone oxidoreductase subunit H [Alistipes sp.]|nr:NADH-quinone oxidoreductase subunit H [Alistipes sp.]